MSADHIFQNFLSAENFPEWKWALSRLQTSKFSMTSFYVTSFVYWCERVQQVYFDNLLVASNVIVPRPTRALANHIKCSDYFDKFSLLTHTDEQNLYFVLT